MTRLEELIEFTRPDHGALFGQGVSLSKESIEDKVKRDTGKREGEGDEGKRKRVREERKNRPVAALLAGPTVNSPPRASPLPMVKKKEQEEEEEENMERTVEWVPPEGQTGKRERRGSEWDIHDDLTYFHPVIMMIMITDIGDGRSELNDKYGY